jgi:hypothetical protein
VYRRATAVGISVVAAIALAPAAAAKDTPSSAPHRETLSIVTVAEHAAPGRDEGSPCYVNGKRYSDGARVPLDPGPRSMMLAPVYVRCVRGRLCTTPASLRIVFDDSRTRKTDGFAQNKNLG